MFEDMRSSSLDPPLLDSPLLEPGAARGPIGNEARSVPSPTTYAVLAIVVVLFGLLSFPLWEGGFLILFAFLVLAVMHSDLNFYLIPDWASLGIACLGLLHSLWPLIADGWFWDLMSLGGVLASTLLPALANGLFAFVLFYAIARLYRFYAGREGLGFGDVKLAAALALWLDPFTFALALQLATLSALLVAAMAAVQQRRRVLLPFGAFLAPSGWILAAVLALSPDLWGLRP